MTNRIIQYDTYSCFACVAAMITGKTVKDVFNFLGHDGSGYKEDSTHPDKCSGFEQLEIVKYLAEYRYTLGIWSQFKDSENLGDIDEIHFELKLSDCPAVLIVKSKRLGDCCTHVVYWDGKNIFDPSPDIEDFPKLNTYDVFDFIPVIKFD